MNVLVVTTFLAVLVVIAAGGVLLTLAFVMLDRIGLGGLMETVRSVTRPSALWLALAVATTATIGSLYLTEVAGFVPCALCWYQRIAMYPLVVVLAVAAVRGDAAVRRYAGPLAAIGALISAYHIAVQRLPGVSSGACSLDAPCDVIYVERFGVITIPVMALVGFVAILTLLFVHASRDTTLETRP